MFPSDERTRGQFSRDDRDDAQPRSLERLHALLIEPIDFHFNACEHCLNPLMDLAKIIDLADDAIISVDRELRIILFNQGAEKIFGYPAEEVKGQPLDILMPPSLIAAHRTHIQEFCKSSVSARRMGERRAIFGRRKNGTEFPAEASISKIEVNEQMIFTVILRDTTQRVINEEKILTLLLEKETLLKEIHHRIKNNLQLISSLLGLQARSISDPDLRKLFLESQQRVHSMALLHETLYQSENLVEIDVARYVRKLAEHLFRSYDGMGSRIRLRTDLDLISLAPDDVVPCGLIVNELVSNALKYAFPGGLEGEIRIGLHAEPNNMAILTVADTGIGLPDGVDWNAMHSLGFRLVHSLAKQLRAKIEVHSQGGTEIRMTFPSAARRPQESA